MKKKYIVPGAVCLLLLNACTKEKSKSEALNEANKVHLESVAIQERIEKEIATRKKSALQKNDSAGIVTLDSLHTLIELWEEGIVEVPGFAHEHHHTSGGHAHEHRATPQMTDESMLDYQRKTKAAIEELQKNLKNLKD